MSQSTQSSSQILRDGWDEEESEVPPDEASVAGQSNASDSVATTDVESESEVPSTSYVLFGDQECRRIYTIKASKSRTSDTRVVCGCQVVKLGKEFCRCNTHHKYPRATAGYYPGLTLRDGTKIGWFTIPLTEERMAVLKLQEADQLVKARKSMEAAAKTLADKSSTSTDPQHGPI